jgi:hypothetical protein
MPAAAKKLLIEQGATWRDSYTLLQPAPAGTPIADLLPINLTGYSARMQIRPDYASATVLLELTQANGRIAITPASGNIAMHISAADTAALTFTDAPAVYDLELIEPSGDVIRLLKGSVTLSPEVTK